MKGSCGRALFIVDKWKKGLGTKAAIDNWP